MVNSKNSLNRSIQLPSRIFLTGASGCVGSYLLSTLLAKTQCQIFVLLRQPDKLPQAQRVHPRLTILHGDLASVSDWQAELGQTEVLIHAAVQWGGVGVYQVNHTQSLKLLSHLNPQICRQIFYFSTASLLGQQGRFNPRTLSAGTDYIRSKASCYLSLHQSEWRSRLACLYPTVVLGGDQTHPLSAASQGLKDIHRWIPWLRYFKASGQFHWIHAEDIASMLLHWLRHPIPAQDLVLGNPAQSVNQVLAEFSQYTQTPPRPQLALETLLPFLLPLLSRQMSDWDRHSLRERQLTYDPVYPKRLGLDSRFQALSAVLSDLDIPSKRQSP
ncbi:MAG: NAD-dependent epimerase/dehydratase family protein [Candidatus Sericytochromatia bacterium]